MSDIHAVPVKAEYLPHVYALLSELEKQSAGKSKTDISIEGIVKTQTIQAIPSSNNTTVSMKFLEKVWNESAPRIKKALEIIANENGGAITGKELRKQLGITSKMFSGMFGAFGHRFKSRYNGATWPLESKYNYATGDREFSMTPDVAEAFKKIIEENEVL